MLDPSLFLVFIQQLSGSDKVEGILLADDVNIWRARKEVTDQKPLQYDLDEA